MAHVDEESKDDRIAELERRIAELTAENARLREQTDERLHARIAQLAALQKVNNAANSTLQLEATLNLIVETVADVMSCDVCSLYLFESNHLVLRATRGLNPAAVGRLTLRLGEGVTGRAALEGRPVPVVDAAHDPRFRYVAGIGEEPYQSMLAVPIILFTYGKLIGVLSIQTRQRKEFSHDEIAFLETVAGQVAIAIENARLYEQTDQQLRRTVEELTMLQQVSTAVVSTLDPHEVLDLVVRQAVRLSRTRQAALFQLEAVGEELKIVAAYGLSPETVQQWRVPLREPGIGQAVNEARTIVLDDVYAEPAARSLHRWAAVEGFRTIFCVPLVTRRRTSGGLVVFADEPGAFTQAEGATLAAFAGNAAIALENAHLYGEAQRNLAVKTALLAEMHHRVKNNLQTVAALLSLQGRRTAPPAAQAFWESVARVQSIAAVHDLLSREHFGTARIADLVRQIMEVVTINLARPETRLVMRLDGDDLWLGSKEATTLALVLNELLGNAARHAFVGRAQGTITVTANAVDGRAIVVVRDDGCGLPADFDLGQSRGLGLQIVQTLVETDLRGRLAIQNCGGVEVVIEFPLGDRPALPSDGFVLSSGP